MELLVNKENGNQYRLLGKVGEGAYAEVFKGETVRTREPVAIKKMKHMKKADAEMARKEVELMRTLHHKNIVRFIDQFRQNGVWYIVLEFCGKGDLQQYKQKVGRIPEYHCKVLVRGVLEALVELHAQRPDKRKIAHRDLKLPNILINDDYQLKLADFGFSKDFEDGWMRSFCGTPLTMAPEVLRRDAYNEKCDVWSLGVITYFLLYNKYPYFPSRSDGAGLDGITNCVLNKPLLFDRTVQVSDAGIDFITQCMQKTLDRRPFSHQLLQHPWFELSDSTRYTQIRENLIGESLAEKPEHEAAALCKAMLGGVVEEHVRKLQESLLVSEDRLRATIALFRRHYSQQHILEYYLLTAQKRIEELSRKSVVLILENRSIKLEAARVVCFGEAYRSSLRFILGQVGQLQSERPALVNIQGELVKFLLTESEQLMECYSEEEIQDKLRLLKEIAKLLLRDHDTSLINVKWGERQDLKRLAPHVLDFIVATTDEQVLAAVNEQLSTDDDLESIWLIEHTLADNRERKPSSLEMELAKQVLYILNIPSNFTAEKAPHTDHLHLDFPLVEL